MRDNLGLDQALLLAALAQQIKLPLLNIARRAELECADGESVNLSAIRATADAGLWLLDSYLLGLELAERGISADQAEPVSVSGLLYDAGQRLEPFAKAYGIALDLRIEGKYGLVTAYRRGLQAALVSLGYAVVESLPAQDSPALRLYLSAHRCRYGIVAGLYCKTQYITLRTLRVGRQLYGRSQQPLADITHTSGAGIFVADALLQAMHTRLNLSRHHSMQGLGAVLPVNPQLRLV